MLNKRGQNIAEYVILVAIIIGAAAAMQIYLKRGISGRIADATDHAPQIADVAGAPLSFNTKQYEPYYADSSSDVTSTSTVSEDLANRGGITRSQVDSTTNRGVGSYDQSLGPNTVDIR